MGELVRETRVARSSGAEVQLLDAAHPDCDNYGEQLGRWVVYCEDHDRSAQHSTWKGARSVLGSPESWCSGCAEEAKRRSNRKAEGFSEEERSRGLETRRRRSEERKAAREKEEAAKRAKKSLDEQWSTWAVTQPLFAPLYLKVEIEEKQRIGAALSDSRGKIASAKKGCEQAEARLEDLPKVKSKREKKNRERLESEVSTLDEIVVEEEAHVEDLEADRDCLTRIAYIRACLKKGWKLELDRDGGGMHLKAGELSLRIPDDYLVGTDWPKVRVMDG